jgi:hypothetical protein
VFADGGMFVGVAWDGSYYYFASTEYGIFKTTDLSTTPTLVSGTEKKTLTGIAAVGQGATKAVVAVCGYPGGDEPDPARGRIGLHVDDQITLHGAIANTTPTRTASRQLLWAPVQHHLRLPGNRLDAQNLVDSTPSFSCQTRTARWRTTTSTPPLWSRAGSLSYQSVEAP